MRAVWPHDADRGGACERRGGVMAALAELLRGRVLSLDSAALAIELLGELLPADRPAVVVHPRSLQPETTAARVSAHERSLRAGDALGRALAALSSEDARWSR